MGNKKKYREESKVKCHLQEKRKYECKQSGSFVDMSYKLKSDKRLCATYGTFTTSSHSKHSSLHEEQLRNKRHSSQTSYNQLNTIKSEEHDSAFPWGLHQVTLNRMFFTETDIIKRGTNEYDDFWIFLKKFQSVQKQSTRKMSFGYCQDFQENELHLPTTYNCCCKINISFIVDVREMMCRGYLFKDGCESSFLPVDRVLEFQYILLLYLNFLQKQKFARLCKLHEAKANLPISQYRSKIVEAVNCHQVVIVAGDTGCGKSTQVPQYLLAAGHESIVCCQPRRIACISLCKRVAYETLNEFGSEVGYQIRFEKNKTYHTKILFVTEGLLLRQVMADPMLSTYKVVILDEVHERHLPCDFLLGIVKCLIHQRPDIKVILMSATINIQLFSDYFDNCPVIQVPGRLFPIEVQYYPISMEDKQTTRLNPTPYVRVMQHIDHKFPPSERGDLLIFLSGVSEILAVEEAAHLYAQQTKKWIILPLHSMLSLEEQDKVFDFTKEGVRKCIISTNIAETSITIDGIRFVVDSGKVKEMSYDSSCRMQQLKEFWISRASAEQRKGRAGRTGPGICFRLYSEAKFESLPPYSAPEIQRVPLDSLLLQMISMGLPDARKFPFLEPPPISKIEASLQDLKEQGALTEDESLTPMGQILARLPVDITFGKMLIMGSVFHLTEPILSLAAAMSVQSPFTHRSYRNLDTMAARRTLLMNHGDPFSLLNAYNSWLEIKSNRRINSKKWCQHRGIEEQRFYEMTKLRNQFRELMEVSGLVKFKEENFNSIERVKRHGELKLLREMKKKFHRNPRRRKFLRLETDIERVANAGSDVEEVGEIDIHDVEFQMSFDRTQAKLLSVSNQEFSHRNLTLLKIILCNGLYPQLACPDEHNSYKSNSEQFFHTKEKPFVVLHPNSVLSLEPDVLHLYETDIHVAANSKPHTLLNTKHQLVAYVSLLETTKPYLVNCLRVPAAHVLLLIAHNLDTDQNFTRIVADGWLEVMFPNGDEAQKFISCAFSIRDLWQEVLQLMFKEIVLKGSKDKEFHPEIRRKMTQLFNGLEKFLHTECMYSVHRLLAADKKKLYVGIQDNTMKFLNDVITSSHDHLLAHPIKGGFQVKDYMTYNCLQSFKQSINRCIQNSWKCPGCSQQMVVTVLQQVRHQEKCSFKAGHHSSEERQQHANVHKKLYFCSSCQKEFVFSTTEILRHKQTHQLVAHAE